MALRQKYAITAVGYDKLKLTDVYTYTVSKRKTKNMALKLVSAMLLALGNFIPSLNRIYGRMNSDYLEMLHFCLANCFDLYHANNPRTLPIAVAAAEKWKAKVVFDAHEYSPDNIVDRISFQRLFASYYTWVLRNYGANAHAMTTVSPGIGALYRQRFRLNSTVILSASVYEELPFNPVKGHQIKLVHHGNASPRRNLEKLIDLMTLLDNRFHLTFYLIGNSNNDYLQHLKEIAEKKSPNRVIFKDPVDMRIISREINHYDLGIFLLPWFNFNQKFVLPNKLFEFIMAGLAVFIGPSPEMARYVKAYECGWVTDSFNIEHCAKILNGLRAGEIDEKKRKSLEAAKVLNAGVEAKKLRSIYAFLLGEEKNRK